MNHIVVKNEVKTFFKSYFNPNLMLGDSKGIKHLAYDSSKGACYYVSKYYNRNVDNDIFLRTKF